MSLSSIYQGIRGIVPDQNAPWRFSSEVSQELQKISKGQVFVEKDITPDTQDYRFVEECYRHTAPTNRIITQVKCVYNQTLRTAFENRIIRSERMAGSSKPKWREQEDAHIREKVFARWQQIASHFHAFKFDTLEDSYTTQNVVVIPVFHGTSELARKAISATGFRCVGPERPELRNDGQALYGNAIYVSPSAECASKYDQGSGELLLAWISITDSPYPVISRDKLQERGFVGTHDAHYIPVRNIAGKEERPAYRACFPLEEGLQPECDEISVFYPDQTLFSYWIRTCVALLAEPARLINSMTISDLSKEILDRLRDGIIPNSSLSVEVVTQLKKITSLAHEKIHSVPEIAFGKREWKDYFNEIVTEPPLPVEIESILSGPNPIQRGERIGEGFFLTLIPKGMTLEKLEKLALSGQKGNRIGFRDKGTTWDQCCKDPEITAHWVLMSKKIIPGSESLYEQNALPSEYEQEGYVIPSCVDAATSIITDYVRRGAIEHYTERSRSAIGYTRCREVIQDQAWTLLTRGKAYLKEPSLIGGLSSKGLNIGVQGGIAGFRQNEDLRNYGVAAAKIFY